MKKWLSSSIIVILSLSVSFVSTGCEATTTTDSVAPATTKSATETETSTDTTEKDTAITNTLHPARNLKGTWRTTFPVKFYIQTDFRTLDGTLEDAASLDRMMTWAITPGANDNEVYVEVSVIDSNIQQVNAIPPISYVPDVFPIQFTGQISSTRLTTPFGVFNFTTDIITGTWEKTESFLYTQKDFTDTNALILNRQ